VYKSSANAENENSIFVSQHRDFSNMNSPAVGRLNLRHNKPYENSNGKESSMTRSKYIGMKRTVSGKSIVI
jgi:hypothetical protein